jgi:hypothetical protein
MPFNIPSATLVDNMPRTKYKLYSKFLDIRFQRILHTRVLFSELFSTYVQTSYNKIPVS